MIFTVLLTGLNANAGAEDTVVDNSVKYGEKYSCVITTTDEKNYTLDVEWNAEPAKFSTTPKWEDKLIYTLKQNGENTDSGYFSNLGFGGGKTELAFNYNKYVFSANASQSTRVGTSIVFMDLLRQKYLLWISPLQCVRYHLRAKTRQSTLDVAVIGA